MRGGQSHAVLTFERGISATIGYQGEEEGSEPLLGEPTRATAGSSPVVQPLYRRVAVGQCMLLPRIGTSAGGAV